MTKRVAQIAALFGAGALALTACGGSNGGGQAAPGGAADAKAAGLTCPGGELAASGSSAQKNAIEAVIADYAKACNNNAKISYNPTGSGDGIKQFNQGQVDFAGTDSSLKTEPKDGVIEADAAKKRCKNNPALNLPMVTGPIAVAYKLQGVDSLTLPSAVIAKIFMGQITTWNDPAIAAANPGVTLPATPIKPFYRSDESGTTENFTKFLKKAAGDVWKAEPAKAWTGKGEGKDKSAGVAEAVKGTEGGISYMEWSYAQDNGLGMAKIDNGAGPVELTPETVGKAVSAAEVKGTGGDLALSLKYAGTPEGAYPALLVTYEVVCSAGADPAKTALIKDFMTYFASDETQKKLTDLGYAPLPEDLKKKVQESVASVK